MKINFRETGRDARPIMKDRDIPFTTAVRALRAANIAFIPHCYDYVDHGGTKHANSVRAAGAEHRPPRDRVRMIKRSRGNWKAFL